jgi:hypothetical protein
MKKLTFDCSLVSLCNLMISRKLGMRRRSSVKSPLILSTVLIAALAPSVAFATNVAAIEPRTASPTLSPHGGHLFLVADTEQGDVVSPGFSLSNAPVGAHPAPAMEAPAPFSAPYVDTITPADTINNPDQAAPGPAALQPATHHHYKRKSMTVVSAVPAPVNLYEPATAGKCYQPVAPLRRHIYEPHYSRPVAAAHPPASLMPTNIWVVTPGETLETALEEWAQQANWHVLYNTEYQYPIQVAATFEGDFTTAGQKLIDAVAASPVPVAEFDLGDSTVVVTSRDH